MLCYIAARGWKQPGTGCRGHMLTKKGSAGANKCRECRWSRADATVFRVSMPLSLSRLALVRPGSVWRADEVNPPKSAFSCDCLRFLTIT
jgi:hypothetical protein